MYEDLCNINIIFILIQGYSYVLIAFKAIWMFMFAYRLKIDTFCFEGFWIYVFFQ